VSNSVRRPGMVSMAAAISVAAAIVPLLFGSLTIALGVAVGGFLMTADIYLLQRVVRGLLREEPANEKEVKKKRRFLVFQYLLKTLGLLVVLGAIIWKTDISPAGLLVGITAALIGPIYVGLRDANVEE